MGIIADIARYHLLVAVQRWAAPMLAILCAHDGLRASSQALPQLQFRASWAPPLTEELDATLRIRLAAMKVIVAAVKPDLLELVRKVEAHRITVPAAERRLLAMLPPAEDLAQEVLARLMERVEAAKPNGGPPKHCNQYGHTGGKHCKLGAGQHDNRHGRESKTKPRKHRNREPKEPTVQEHETFHVSEPVETETAFEKRAVRLKKNYGKPGRGFQAPGMKEEFFVSGNVVEELRSGKHIRRSADKVSHLTAADNIDYLWERSYPFKKYRDKEKVFENSTIEWMYKRLAYMDLRGKRYEVEITAKEFKRDVNILYQVKTRAIK